MKKTRLRQLFEVVRYSGEKEELEEELSAVDKDSAQREKL